MLLEYQFLITLISVRTRPKPFSETTFAVTEAKQHRFIIQRIDPHV